MIIIDDSGDRKDGTATAHVGRQWLGRLGKTGLRFDGSHARPGRNAVSIVLDLEARMAELMTHTGQVTRPPL
ncbi:hypothetical protein GCM10010357_41020 [Streptomyces luteireticuli]|uniref:Transposase IS701-like DDE domain-containing protein n=1 Tax=Streptomyces luteireticuli TaxID=173858 RepID=A0ABN0YWX7_9ACTN